MANKKKELLDNVSMQALTAWLIYFWLSQKGKQESAYLIWECKEKPLYSQLDDYWKHILLALHYAETWDERGHMTWV